LDVATRQVQRLTQDAFADLQPAWSPDGTKLAFVTDRFTSDESDLQFGEYRLALMDVQSKRIDALKAFDRGKHTNPEWGPNGNSLFFISDRDGISNIYRIGLGSGRIAQVTNLETGASGITSVSPAFSVASKAERLAFSTFLDGDYRV
jgi:Tol biopolymer transport system component